ncbi:apolipoprotein N-acyltransferase [Sphingomonas piscis]|uniref:apolipoprotein N-acyltransferase n=1 Tax=Sphingomonas piscis TaxID=2714943 RepID=UPI001FEA4BB4|nr:hypothetical protein [Sphingomonas piscis]
MFARLARHSGVAALAVGAVSALAFEPIGFTPLMPIAIALLCALLSRAETARQALLVGWLFGLGQFVVGLNWLPTSFTYQANMPAWLGWLALLLLSIYLAVFPALATGLAWRVGRRNPMALVVALAGTWGLTEWLRATVFTGFAWNPLAASAVGETRFLVPLIGTYGASMFIALVGGGIWLMVERRSRALFAIAAAGIAAGFAIGVIFEPPASASKAVRIVQPNIGQEQKWRPGLADDAFARLGRLSVGGATSPRLLFWPEVAVPQPFQLIDSTGSGASVPLPRHSGRHPFCARATCC